MKKRWEKKQRFCIDVGVFNTEVMVFVNHSEREILAWAKKAVPDDIETVKEEIENWDEHVASRSEDGRMCRLAGSFFVLLKPYANLSSTVSSLVHELTHVTQYLLRRRRVPLTQDTEEVHAYLIDYLVREAANKML